MPTVIRLITALLLALDFAWAQALTFTTELTPDLSTTLFAEVSPASEEREVEVRGVRTGESCAPLPGWLSVTAPHSLPAGAELLFITARAERPEATSEPLTICIALLGGEEVNIEWQLQPPGVPLISVATPAEVIADQHHPTTLLLPVTNAGGVDARVSFTFRGASITAPDTTVPAGATITVTANVPPQPAGRRRVTYALHGGDLLASGSFELVTLGAASDGYGATLTLSANSRREGGLHGGARAVVAGQMARGTSLNLSIATYGVEGHLRHQHTTVVLNSEVTTVAGRAAAGLHLEQRLPGELAGVTLGAILHPQEGVRLGARAASDDLTLHLHSDLRAAHHASGTYTSRYFLADAEWDTSRTRPFTVRLSTFTAPLRLSYRGHLGGEQATHHLRASFVLAPDAPNSARANFSVVLQGVALHSYAIELSDSGRSLKWVTWPAAAQSTLTYRQALTLDLLDLALDLQLPLRAPERTSLKATAHLPLGAWLTATQALVTATPDLTLTSAARRALT